MGSSQRSHASQVSRDEILRKRAALHDRMENDPDFVKEAKEIHERMAERGERSPDAISAPELAKRVRGRTL